MPYAIYIYSNDGSTLLKSFVFEAGGTSTLSVNADGVTVSHASGDSSYTYSGSGTFLGLSNVSNSSTPTIAIGGTFSDSGTSGTNFTFYIVEEEPTTSSGTTYEILYNDEVINTVEPGNKIEIHCAGDIMDYNIVVRPVVESNGYTVTFKFEQDSTTSTPTSAYYLHVMTVDGEVVTNFRNPWSLGYTCPYEDIIVENAVSYYYGTVYDPSDRLDSFTPITQDGEITIKIPWLD